MAKKKAAAPAKAKAKKTSVRALATPVITIDSVSISSMTGMYLITANGTWTHDNGGHTIKGAIVPNGANRVGKPHSGDFPTITIFPTNDVSAVPAPASAVPYSLNLGSYAGTPGSTHWVLVWLDGKRDSGRRYQFNQLQITLP